MDPTDERRPADVVSAGDDFLDEYLMHYGVKGMKWGVRRADSYLSNKDRQLNINQRAQLKVASGISALAAVGIATNAAATLFQLQARFERLQVAKAIADQAANNPFLDEASRQALVTTKNHIVKGIIGSAMATTAVSSAIGAITHRGAKAYFAPLHKVYGDNKAAIKRDIRKLNIEAAKSGKTLSTEAYNRSVSRIVKQHMTKDKSALFSPFHQLARSQMGTEYNTRDINVKFEKLPNTDLYSKMTVTTPDGLRLVKAVKTVRHADEDEPLEFDFYFDYKFDEEGRIVDFSCPTIEVMDDIFNQKLDVAAVAERYNTKEVETVKHDDDDFLDEYLMHYGVKGMKWGVRRELSRTAPGDRDAVLARREKKVLSKLNDPKVHAKVQRRWKRETKVALKSLQKQYKEQGINLKKDRVAQLDYMSKVDSYTKAAFTVAAERSGLRSKTRLYEPVMSTTKSTDGFKIEMKYRENPKVAKQLSKIDKSYDKRAKRAEKKEARIKHADEDITFEDLTADDLPTVTIFLETDDKGYIIDDIDEDDLDDDLDHDDQEFLDEYLMHYGVKGMKWGVRRAVDSATGLIRGSKYAKGESKDGGSKEKPKSSDGEGDTPKPKHKSADHERMVTAMVKRSDAGDNSSLSNEEINMLTKRINAEKSLNQLVEGKSELQKQVDTLELQKKLRALKAEEAEANMSGGKKLAKSLVGSFAKGVKGEVESQLQDLGGGMVKDLMSATGLSSGKSDKSDKSGKSDKSKKDPENDAPTTRNNPRDTGTKVYTPPKAKEKRKRGPSSPTDPGGKKTARSVFSRSKPASQETIKLKRKVDDRGNVYFE